MIDRSPNPDVKPMTDSDLAAARALCDAATEGPWQWWTSNSFRRLTGADGRDGGVLCPVTQLADRHPDVICSEADRTFIAASRTLIPQLLDEIDRLRTVNANSMRTIQSFCSDVDMLQRRLSVAENELERMRGGR